jgi:UDP-4-amino-4,6-dideoxy-N-acetyl-beta-L-altrosamine N-acetyltransferase
MVFRKLLNYFYTPMLDTLTVRALSQDDLAMVLLWRNHPAVRSFMLTQHEITQQEHLNWFERVQFDNTRQQLIVMDSTKPIGFVQFSPTHQAGVSDWGFYARPDAPKGSGRKLGQAALRYAFIDMGLHKVCGQTIESNTASIAFHQSLGFKKEGILREQQRIGHRQHTLFCFGLLVKDWLAGQ